MAPGTRIGPRGFQDSVSVHDWLLGLANQREKKVPIASVACCVSKPRDRVRCA